MSEEDEVAMVQSARFRTVQLNADEPVPDNGKPTDRTRFTPGFMDALVKRYRLEARLGNSVIFVPND